MTPSPCYKFVGGRLLYSYLFVVALTCVQYLDCTKHIFLVHTHILGSWVCALIVTCCNFYMLYVDVGFKYEHDVWTHASIFHIVLCWYRMMCVSTFTSVGVWARARVCVVSCAAFMVHQHCKLQLAGFCQSDMYVPPDMCWCMTSSLERFTVLVYRLHRWPALCSDPYIKHKASNII